MLQSSASRVSRLLSVRSFVRSFVRSARWHAMHSMGQIVQLILILLATGVP
jgi:hypothetical protein